MNKKAHSSHRSDSIGVNKKVNMKLRRKIRILAWHNTVVFWRPNFSDVFGLFGINGVLESGNPDCLKHLTPVLKAEPRCVSITACVSCERLFSMIKYWRSTCFLLCTLFSLVFQAGPSQGVQKKLWTETLTTMLTPFPPVVAAEKQIEAQKQLCSCNTLWHL